MATYDELGNLIPEKRGLRTLPPVYGAGETTRVGPRPVAPTLALPSPGTGFAGAQQVFSGHYAGGIPTQTPTTTSAIAYDLNYPYALWTWNGTAWSGGSSIACDFMSGLTWGTPDFGTHPATGSGTFAAGDFSVLCNMDYVNDTNPIAVCTGTVNYTGAVCQQHLQIVVVQLSGSIASLNVTVSHQTAGVLLNQTYSIANGDAPGTHDIYFNVPMSAGETVTVVVSASAGQGSNSGLMGVIEATGHFY